MFHTCAFPVVTKPEKGPAGCLYWSCFDRDVSYSWRCKYADAARFGRFLLRLRQSTSVQVPLFYSSGLFGLSNPDSTYKMTHSNAMFWHYCVEAVVSWLFVSYWELNFTHGFFLCRDESNWGFNFFLTWRDWKTLHKVPSDQVLCNIYFNCT